MPFLTQQMQFLYFLQQFRSPVIDWIFRCLNIFDTDYFICSLIAFIWIGFSWKWGVRLGGLMIVSGWINAMAKLFFCWPRPFFVDSSLAIVQLHDYGFPSGGAQNAMLFAGLIIYFWKSRWAWPLGIFYCILISFSRIFLGVHFPTDVLGGWILGVMIFILFIKSYRATENFAARHPAGVASSIVATAFMLGYIFRDYKTSFLMTSLAVMAIGVYFSTKYRLYLSLPQELRKKIFLGLFGICSSILLTLFAMMLTPDLFLTFKASAIVSGLWISLLASPFCKRVFLDWL